MENKISAILEFLKSNNAPAEVLTAAESLKTVNLDSVKEFLEQEEAGKKYLQSQKDAAVTKGIETFKDKTMPNFIDEEIKKKFPEETEEQKRLRKLEDENKKFQNEVKREKLLNKAISYAQEKGYPTKFIDRFLGEDEESTVSNIEQFGDMFNTSISKAVDDKFKAGGRATTPEGGNGKPSEKTYNTFAEWKAENS